MGISSLGGNARSIRRLEETMRLNRRYRSLGGVLAIAGATAASPACAVSIEQGGFGQVLVFPYYTVRAASSGNAYSTLFTVTNTGVDTKVIRVRFRESRNGRQVASVNVYLTPHDSWTGSIVGGESGPSVGTRDESCTDPATVNNTQPLAFTNAEYSGSNADGEDPSLARSPVPTSPGGRASAGPSQSCSR